MIFQKLPIKNGRLSISQVSGLISIHLGKDRKAPVFYDIETTGLSHSTSYLYLAGAICYENENWTLYQWFAASPQEEPQVLEAFADFIKKRFDCTVQYNGNQFDQPYLSARFRLFHIENPLEALPSLDLYRILRPLKTLLKLPSLKQPQWETFLGLPPRLHCDGKECIRLYRQLMKSGSREETILHSLLGHNAEDLSGLLHIISALSYLDLFSGRYDVSDCSFQEEQVLFSLKPHHPIPTLFSNGKGLFYITGLGESVHLSVPASDGILYLYYTDYKNYDFIPSEGRAIPKSLSSYLDKSLRVPATADTCYTPIPCNETFLITPSMQKQYLEHSLPHYLHSL